MKIVPKFLNSGVLTFRQMWPEELSQEVLDNYPNGLLFGFDSANIHGVTLDDMVKNKRHDVGKIWVGSDNKIYGADSYEVRDWLEQLNTPLRLANRRQFEASEETLQRNLESKTNHRPGDIFYRISDYDSLLGKARTGIPREYWDSNTYKNMKWGSDAATALIAGWAAAPEVLTGMSAANAWYGANSSWLNPMIGKMAGNMAVGTTADLVSYGITGKTLGGNGRELIKLTTGFNGFDPNSKMGLLGNMIYNAGSDIAFNPWYSVTPTEVGSAVNYYGSKIINKGLPSLYQYAINNPEITSGIVGGISEQLLPGGSQALEAGLPSFMLNMRSTRPYFSSKTGKEMLPVSSNSEKLVAYHGGPIAWPKEWKIPPYDRTPATARTTYVIEPNGQYSINTIGEYSGSNPLTAIAYPERYFDEGIAQRFGFGSMNKGFGFKFGKDHQRKDLAEVWESPSVLEALETIDRKWPGEFSNEDMSLWADIVRLRPTLIENAVGEVRVTPDFTIRTNGLYNGKPLILEDSYIPGMEDLVRTDYGAVINVTPELVERYGGATYDPVRGGYVLNKPKNLPAANHSTLHTDTNELGLWLSTVGLYDSLTGKFITGSKTKPITGGKQDWQVPYRGLAIEGIKDATRINSQGRNPITGTTYITPVRSKGKTK